MEKEKLRWYVVSKEYVDFLQKHDKRVENIDYKVKLKPYIGIILKQMILTIMFLSHQLKKNIIK